jgi:hypothetical protein
MTPSSNDPGAFASRRLFAQLRGWPIAAQSSGDSTVGASELTHADQEREVRVSGQRGRAD